MCAVVEASDWPDDGDEPRAGSDPYLPPDQRWWRHPSELGATPAPRPLPAGRPALLPAPGAGRVVLALAVVIGAAGAVLAAYVAHLARPATEDVATSVVRVSSVTTPIVTVATTAPVSAMQGVVQLVLPGRDHTRSGTAAAMSTGQLVTSAEAVAGVTAVTAVMPDGTEQQATVVWVDTASGTAVLEVAEPTPTLASGQAATLDPGDPVTAAGTNTLGEVVAVGVEATADDGTHMEHLLRLRMEQPVDFGAVLLDEGGRAVGICIGQDSEDTSTMLAAPIELAKAAIGTPGANGTRPLAWLGLTGRTATAEDVAAPETTVPPPASSDGSPSTQDTSPPTTEAATTTSAAPPTAQPAPAPKPSEPVRGAYVEAVDPDGPAALAGVQEGDVVVAVDDVPVSSMNALILLVRERRAGRSVHLALVRDGETIEVDAVLRRRPPTT